MRETITTALDVLGLLLVAAGVVVFGWPYVGGGGLAIAGAFLMAVSAVVDRPVRTRVRKPDHAGEAGR